MPDAAPALCVGLPILNGERYLATAIESLLAQTYGDFRLVLVDNASTDGTAEICRAYARRDARVVYHRNESNIGAAGNTYRALDLSDARYFKWAACDDEYAPEFLERCVSVLEQDPEVVLCYTRAIAIDEHGARGARLQVAIDTASRSPSVRLASCIDVDYLCIQLYGVMRTDVLRRATRYAGYVGEDRNLLAELCLRGPVVEIPEYLFFHRLSPRAWGARVSAPDVTVEELLAYDPTINWRMKRLAPVRRFANYFAAVSRVPLSPGERLRCYRELVRLLAKKLMARYRSRRGRGTTGADGQESFV